VSGLTTRWASGASGETRWASGADSLCTFRRAYSVLIQALESLSSDGDGKARGYLCSIRQFDFIIALCAAEHVLSNTVALLNMLQGKDVDLIEAANEPHLVINVLREDVNHQRELCLTARLCDGKEKRQTNHSAVYALLHQ